MDKQLYSLTIDKEFSELIPPLTREERDQLEENIMQDGCRDALIIWDETIVDGHNRYEICHRRGIPFSITQKDFYDRDAAKEFIILNQFGRRNLKPFQCVELAEQYRPILEKQANERMTEGKKINDPPTKSSEGAKGETREKLARLAGVGQGTIQRGRKVIESATDEEKQALREGHTTINKVYTDIRQREALTQTQTCTKCGQEKSLTDFYVGRTVCKACKGLKPSEFARQAYEVAELMRNNDNVITPDSELYNLANDLSICAANISDAAARIPFSSVGEEAKKSAMAAIVEAENAVAELKKQIGE